MNELKVCYDIECVPNFFCIVFSPLDSDKVVSYEISERRDDRDQIKKVAEGYKLIGYNSHGYDDIMLRFLFDNMDCNNMDLYRMSKAIISKDRDTVNNYKYKKGLESIDIMTFLASSKLRKSLKHLQVVIKWHNLEEFEVDWDAELPKDRWDPCISYCVNDVLSLKAVCKELTKGFALREFVHEQTGLNVESLDPVKIAEYTMSQSIAKGLGMEVDWFMRKTVNENVPVGNIVVKDLLFPFIKFKTARFNAVLDVYKGLEFDPAVEQPKKPEQKWGHPMRFGKMWLVFGLGGLHHNYGKKTGKKKFKSRGLIHAQVPGTQLLMPDVSSYYPRMRIEHIPHPLDPHLLVEYTIASDDKTEAKAQGDKDLEAYAKLRLNSLYGNYNNLFSPVYAPKVSYATAICGQLMLAMLIEALDLAGVEVLGTNTDSVTVRVKDSQLEEYHKICSEWERITKMALDHDQFEAIYEQSCNNYIAVMPGGYIKAKGTLVPGLDMLKGYMHPIVKTAVIDYFTKGVKIEDTIRGCDDIYDFCMTSKMGTSTTTGKRFEAFHKGVKLQRTNRYYAGTGPMSGYLYKNCGTGDQHVMKDTGVIIMNEYKELSDYSINYLFYERAARKIIREIEPEQLTMLL